EPGSALLGHNGQALQLDLARLRASDQLQMTEDRVSTAGYQDTTQFEVLVKLARGIFGELEQPPQRRPWSFVPLDPHVIPFVDAGVRRCCGYHDPVPIGVEECLPESIPV